MKKRHQSKPELIASYSLQVVLLATLLIALWKQEWIWVIGCFIAIFIGFVPSLIHRDINFLLPWQIELLIATVASLNMVGVLLDAYYTIPGFGEITQFFTSVLVAFISFAIIYILHVYWDGLIMDKYAMAFVVVLATMASGVILEFVKQFKLFGAVQTSVEGVLTSLFISTLSGIFIAIVGVSLIKRGEFDDITEDLGKQFESMLNKQKKKK